MPGAAPVPSVEHVSDADQVWTLDHQGRTHRVEASGAASHQVRWLVDGELVTEKQAWEEKLTLDGAECGRVVVRFSTFGKARRATLFDADEDAQALAGIGGVDLVPEAGSPASAYEDRIRLHPQRYAAIATLVGVAKVVVPLLVGLLAIRLAVSIPWPDLPFPNLPDIPWPDLPSIPVPDLPDVRLPDWLRWLLDKVKYVWPIVLAYVLARAEINRRRKQDELRRAPGSTESEERNV